MRAHTFSLPQVVVDRLVSLAQSLLDEHGISWEDTLYVGIACPGQIDRCVGTCEVAYACVLLYRMFMRQIPNAFKGCQSTDQTRGWGVSSRVVLL